MVIKDFLEGKGKGMRIFAYTVFVAGLACYGGTKLGRPEGIEQGRKEMTHATASYLLNHAAVHRNAGTDEDTIRANELESRAHDITASDPDEFVRENSDQSAAAIKAYGLGL